jgi:hypothetical protein
MLYLQFIIGLYALVFWIIGLFIGILLSNMTGIDIQKMTILFGGTGVVGGVIIGHKVIDHAIYTNKY